MQSKQQSKKQKKLSTELADINATIQKLEKERSELDDEIAHNKKIYDTKNILSYCLDITDDENIINLFEIEAQVNLDEQYENDHGDVEFSISVLFGDYKYIYIHIYGWHEDPHFYFESIICNDDEKLLEKFAREFNLQKSQIEVINDILIDYLNFDWIVHYKKDLYKILGR